MIFTITLRNEGGKNKSRNEKEGKENGGAVNSKPANKAEILMMNNGQLIVETTLRLCSPKRLFPS